MGTAGVRLGRVAPMLFVRDIARAMRFYGDVFGLAKTFENGDPVAFVILKRDDAEVHLTRVPDHVGCAENVMHMIVHGVDELYRRCQAADGARIVKPLRDAPWGLRTFVVADPDGNCIDIGERI
ncbi:MAG TPA: glyoxalase superfamily protein [Polyangia bacterium]